MVANQNAADMAVAIFFVLLSCVLWLLVMCCQTMRCSLVSAELSMWSSR